MDPVKLHHNAEQRCKPFGCDLVRCMSDAKDSSKCSKAMKALMKCVDEQKEILLKEYESSKGN